MKIIVSKLKSIKSISMKLLVPNRESTCVCKLI